MKGVCVKVERDEDDDEDEEEEEVSLCSDADGLRVQGWSSMEGVRD